MAPTRQPARLNHDALLAYFTQLAPTASWADLEDHASSDLLHDWNRVIAALGTLGYPAAYVADLSQDQGAGISAVKVVVPGARCADWI
jgi:ribosomal protein S12 methylthiotransferase accessory factor YcaO